MFALRKYVVKLMKHIFQKKKYIQIYVTYNSGQLNECWDQDITLLICFDN